MVVRLITLSLTGTKVIIVVVVVVDWVVVVEVDSVVLLPLLFSVDAWLLRGLLMVQLVCKAKVTSFSVWSFNSYK